MALPRLPAPPAATYDGRMRLQDASDEWLAKRAARGDADAFEQLVLRYQDRLYTLALRVTLSEPDARDCVQEGLISAWRAIDRFRGDARFSTWIYRIVLRKAYDVLDRRKRTAEPMEEIVIASADRPADDRLDLIAALATLEPDFRAAVVACDIIGMGMDEAAAALEVPAGTVKSRLHRGALAPGRRAGGPPHAMTDNGHTDHEQLARRLHEQGQAQAPPDLAGDVMRRVRAEPRRPQRAWLRPVALCATVAVLLLAGIAGLTRIGGSGQSSSAGSAAETHSRRER